MSAMARMVMGKFYRSAGGDRTRLPWNRDEPGAVLVAAVGDVSASKPRSRALDVGCGAGVFSVWLAKRGLETTGIDLFPEAIAMARSVAAGANVNVELIAGVLFMFEPVAPFELVYDSGCLRSLVGGDVASYKRQLLRWLAARALRAQGTAVELFLYPAVITGSWRIRVPSTMLRLPAWRGNARRHSCSGKSSSRLRIPSLAPSQFRELARFPLFEPSGSQGAAVAGVEETAGFLIPSLVTGRIDGR